MQHFFKKYFANRYFGIYKHAKTLFLFDIFLLILAISLLGSGLFFNYWQPSIAKQIEINFSYSSEKIISGQNLEIYVEYKNNSQAEMKNSVLALHLPLGFSLDIAKNPLITDKNTFNLGNIPSGGNGKLAIIGQIIGNTTEKDKITAILTYKIGNSKKIEQRQEMGLIEYTGAEIRSELKIEKSSFPDKTLPFSIKMANLSEKTIDNVGLILPNFAKISSKLPHSLLPNQEIVLTGFFEVPKTIGLVPFSYQITRAQNNLVFVQQEEKIQIEVLSPDIILKIIPQATYTYLESGNIFKIDVSFENLSRNSLQDQILTLQDPNQILNLLATAKINDIKENGKDLIIDKTIRNSFEDNSPIKSDHFTLNFKLKDNAGALSSNLKIVPIFSAKLFGSDINFSITGTEINIPITSLLQTTIFPRYYTRSGDQVGRGPLPPQIDQKTSYWIYADIKNGANPLADFKFVANTSEKAAVTGKQSVSYGNEMTINNTDVIWQKDTVSAFTTIGLYFEVEVTPSAADLGKELELIKEIKIEATDSLTGKKYLLNFGPVTNKLLPEDAGSEVNNKVVE